jgi:PIN domain nuclease of toxin-antitoxin system
MVNYLLDSNAFLWSKTSPKDLRRQTLEEIGKAENRLFVSIASLWELAIKAANGKLEHYARMVARGSDGLLGALRESNIQLLPIELAHALAASRLPQHHRDPFDRVLIAQAQLEGLVIVTSDAIFTRYDVRVLRA